MTTALTGCVAWCTCEDCVLRKAATSIRRLLFARWLVDQGRITEGELPGNFEPWPALLFLRWRVQTARLVEAREVAAGARA